MKIHEVKTQPHFFFDAVLRIKTFTIRKDDRGYQVGDILRKINIDPFDIDDTQKQDFMITYKIAGGQFGIEPGYCVLGIDRL